MEIKEIIAERDEVKSKLEELERQVAHHRELYQALEAVVRLKGRSRGLPPIPSSSPSPNGTSPAEVNRRQVVLEILKENPNLDVGQIRNELNNRKVSIKEHYVYNLLSALYKSKKVDRKDGKYSVK